MVVTMPRRPAPGPRPGWLPASRKGDGDHVGDAEAGNGHGDDRDHGSGANPAPAMPRAAIRLDTRKVATAPKNRPRMPSPTNRISAMVCRKRRQSPSRRGDVGPEFLLEIKRAPVEHGPFRHHGQKRNHADQIDQRVGRQAQRLA